LDFLHKLSTKLAQFFQRIVLENLNISGMLKNRKLARAIAQQGWSILRQLLEFKAAKYLRELRVIDRWEPTSQVCSSCGYRWFEAFSTRACWGMWLKASKGQVRPVHQEG